MPADKRTVRGFENYEVDRNGTVYIKPEYNRHRIKNPSGALQPVYNVRHYVVYLRKNNKSYRKLIHRLVLEAWRGPCPKGYVSVHLDGDRLNNSLDNLKWGKFEETKHEKTMKLRRKHYRMNKELVRELRKRHREGETIPSIRKDKKFSSFSLTYLYAINCGKRWKLDD